MSQPIGSDQSFETALLKKVVFDRVKEFFFEKKETEKEKSYYIYRHKITTHILVLDTQGKTHMPHDTMGIIPTNEWSALNFAYRLQSYHISHFVLESLFGNPIPPQITHLNHTHRSLANTHHPVTLPYGFHEEDPIFLFWNKKIEKGVWVDLDLNFYGYKQHAIEKPISFIEGIDILLAKGESARKLSEVALSRYECLKTHAEAESARKWKKYTVLLGTEFEGSYWH